mmetsp:Transcript_57129/g.131556  ORF Transcript_57129/g.131556 Transcript_57129/m.131556 type:complete len:311 (+) Transcript_57129:167-1099(+)
MAWSMSSVGEVNELERMMREKLSDGVTAMPITMDGFPPSAPPSSSVIKRVSKWQDEVMLIPHEAFRMYMGWMEVAVASFHPTLTGHAWKPAVFFQWYNDWFYPAVHEHISSMSSLFFPALEEICGEFPKAKSSANHEELIRRMNGIRDMESVFVDAEGDFTKITAAVQELQQQVKDFRKFMTEHFAWEEKIVPQMLLEKGIPKATVDALTQQIIQREGLSGNALLLPGILYALHSWAGDEGVEQLRSEMPSRIRFLNDKFWDRAWRKKSLGVIRSIIADEDPEDQRKPMMDVLLCSCLANNLSSQDLMLL